MRVWMHADVIKMIPGFQMDARRVEQGHRCCVVLLDSDGCPHVRTVIFLSFWTQSAVNVHFESEAGFKTSAGCGPEYSVLVSGLKKKHHVTKLGLS